MKPDALHYRCPFCDSTVRVGQPCPGCSKRGKSKRPPAKKPWEQDHSHDGLDLPDSDFDHDDFVVREFGGAPHRRIGVKWYWWTLGIVAIAAMLAAVVARS